ARDVCELAGRDGAVDGPADCRDDQVHRQPLQRGEDQLFQRARSDLRGDRGEPARGLWGRRTGRRGVVESDVRDARTLPLRRRLPAQGHRGLPRIRETARPREGPVDAAGNNRDQPTDRAALRTDAAPMGRRTSQRPLTREWRVAARLVLTLGFVAMIAVAASITAFGKSRGGRANAPFSHAYPP